jgi:hypothetical protein
MIGLTKRLAFTLTALLWLLATAAYAFIYVNARIHLPGAEGYETQWDWQLFFFSITRLPFLVLALALALYIEERKFRSLGFPSA